MPVSSLHATCNKGTLIDQPCDAERNKNTLPRPLQPLLLLLLSLLLLVLLFIIYDCYDCYPCYADYDCYNQLPLLLLLLVSSFLKVRQSDSFATEPPLTVYCLVQDSIRHCYLQIEFPQLAGRGKQCLLSCSAIALYRVVVVSESSNDSPSLKNPKNIT